MPCTPSRGRSWKEAPGIPESMSSRRFTICTSCGRGRSRPGEAADFLFVPTTGTTYTIAEVEADPIRLNANLGVYTNFVNLLDLCALAVPVGFDSGRRPVGATLIAPCFSEMALIDIGGELHRRAGLPMGAGERPVPDLA